MIVPLNDSAYVGCTRPARNRGEPGSHTDGSEKNEPRHSRLVGFGYDRSSTTPPPQSNLPRSSMLLDGRVNPPVQSNEKRRDVWPTCRSAVCE
jgi:hypothetical protein